MSKHVIYNHFFAMAEQTEITEVHLFRRTTAQKLVPRYDNNKPQK
jgi:hypothetical protein